MKAEMKKILFVINTMGYGGAERALLNLISALEKEQYEISVFVLTGQGELIHQIPDSVTLLNKNYKDVSVLTSKGRMELMKTILRAGILKGAFFRRFSYLLLGISQFFKCRSSRGYIVLDGVKRVEFNNILFISCHIQPSEGGGFVFAPKADGKDGLMNICVVSHSNRMKLIPLLLGAMTGRKKRYKGTRTYECREVKIHTDAPLPVHVDGEVCGNVNDIQAECIPRKVRMMF